MTKPAPFAVVSTLPLSSRVRLMDQRAVPEEQWKRGRSSVVNQLKETRQL